MPTSTLKLNIKLKAFTLVELLISVTIGFVVLAAVAQIFFLTFKTIHKNQLLDKALTTTRLVQEHLNRELSAAISQTETPVIQPLLSGSSTTVTSGGSTATYYSTLTYRVAVGSVATVASTTANGSIAIPITCFSNTTIEPGDYLMITNPASGKLLKIEEIDGTLAPTGGTLLLTLDQTLASAQAEAGTSPIIDVLANTVVTIQRERRYEVVKITGSDLYELRWYPNVENDSYLVLSSNVDPSNHELFARMPEGSLTEESSIKWRFGYMATEKERASNTRAGGNTAYYQANYTEGMIMPKSGNPISSASYIAELSPAYSGTYSTTLQTTTAGTSTTALTTTAGTSTTLQSTSTAGTSTTLKTTTAGTSTTKQSTTLQTSTAGTSTTHKSTTLQTSTAGTSTTKQSTTLKTTTKGTSTTKQSTTLVTTTKGTSTTHKSTTLLTTLLTSTAGTSTTLKSTTLKTTTSGTSTTNQSTTTAGTSTTNKSTTTAGTSTTAKSTSTTKITTTISYDG